MGLKCGIVGLPNVGKSTIFNALSAAGALVENYPFATIEPNVGVVPIPDPRLEHLAQLIQPDKVTPNILEIVDIAGLVKGASQGEGLGNKFLSHIREVDAIIHVVRCFEDPLVTHMEGHVDPIQDLEVVETELALADLETFDRRMERYEKGAKRGDKEAEVELPLLKKIAQGLKEGKMVREMPLHEDETQRIRPLTLLTAKPTLYVANISENELQQESHMTQRLREYASKRGSDLVKICGKIEAEIALLPKEEQETFLKDLGIEESGLNHLIREAFKLLNLITFFTAGKKEVRAWSVERGSHAPQAAGKIHSDFERGFIRAEVYHYNDLLIYPSEQEIKAHGLIRSEGKDYVVKDGDIMLFRFNV